MKKIYSKLLISVVIGQALCTIPVYGMLRSGGQAVRRGARVVPKTMPRVAPRPVARPTLPQQQPARSITTPSMGKRSQFKDLQRPGTTGALGGIVNPGRIPSGLTVRGMTAPSGVRAMSSGPEQLSIYEMDDLYKKWQNVMKQAQEVGYEQIVSNLTKEGETPFSEVIENIESQRENIQQSLSRYEGASHWSVMGEELYNDMGTVIKVLKIESDLDLMAKQKESEAERKKVERLRIKREQEKQEALNKYLEDAQKRKAAIESMEDEID